MKKFIFLVLNIYTLNVFIIQAQELHLKITAETDSKTAVLDSVGYAPRHDSFKSLAAAVDSTALNLQRQGYLNLIQNPIERANDTLFTSEFILNKKYASLKIYLPENSFSTKQLSRVDKNATASSVRIPIELVEPTLNYLNQLQTSSGAAFSSLQLSEIEVNETGVEAELIIRASQKRRIDKIEVKGYDKFPRSFITYGSRIKKGQVFNRADLERRAERLNNLSFANTRKDPEILFTKDSTTIYLYLEKKKANAFDGFLGFSNDPETDDLELNGYLDLSLTNNLNYGETLNLSYKADGSEQVQFKVNLNLPYLFKSPVGALLDLEIFRRDSTFVTVDQAARANYQITNNANVFLGYKGTTSNNLQDNNIAGTAVEDFTSNYINFGGQFLKPTNSNLFPTKFAINLNAQVGTREREISKDNQLRGTLNGQYTFNLNNRNSIYARNTASLLLSENIIGNELFRLGGILSIRGFEENSIDASLFNVLQTEYRYLLSSNLYAHSVFDYAYYENEVLNIRQQLLSVGFGLGLTTNAGLLKLIFANGKTEDQSFDFDNTKVHLSLFARF